MRQGQQNRRGRGRGRKPQNPLARSFESNGPDVKIRGTAAHVAEKYTSLARDAMASGDLIAAESYLQHAEHYNRIIMAAQTQFGGQPNAHQGEGPNGGGYRQPTRWHSEGSDDDADVEAGDLPSPAEAGFAKAGGGGSDIRAGGGGDFRQGGGGQDRERHQGDRAHHGGERDRGRQGGNGREGAGEANGADEPEANQPDEKAPDPVS